MMNGPTRDAENHRLMHDGSRPCLAALKGFDTYQPVHLSTASKLPSLGFLLNRTFGSVATGPPSPAPMGQKSQIPAILARFAEWPATLPYPDALSAFCGLNPYLTPTKINLVLSTYYVTAQVPRQKAVYGRARPKMMRFSAANSSTDLDTTAYLGHARAYLGSYIKFRLRQK
jgi:hypothetical protein